MNGHNTSTTPPTPAPKAAFSKMDFINLLKSNAVTFTTVIADQWVHNAHITDSAPPCSAKQVDALLAMFLNHAAAHQGMDYGIHAHDLEEERAALVRKLTQSERTPQEDGPS